MFLCKVPELGRSFCNGDRLLSDLPEVLMERHFQWLWDLSKWKGQGRKLEKDSLIQQPAERSKAQTHGLQREWDENLGNSRDYTELFITQGVIDFTGNKSL